MDWLDRMNRAMDYIEAQLRETVDFSRAAELACCSTYHFQRMFSFVTGVPLSEYIRRRRLTLAAFDLQNTNARVIDLAFRYGYESPESFSRAFHKLHGISPAAARNKGVRLKAFPRMSFHISIKGDTAMDYRIEEREGFSFFGLELDTNVVDGQCYRDIPAFWEDCVQDGRCTALLAAAGKKPGDLLDLGVTYDHRPDGGMRYMIACLKKTRAVPEEYAVYSVPKQNWAIFSVAWKNGQDAAALHDVWQRIYTQWFPTADYEHAALDFDLEYYFEDAKAGACVEIWIPVVKKAGA